MGKIYDALEKREKLNKTKVLTKKAKRNKPSVTKSQKSIVRLSDKKQIEKKAPEFDSKLITYHDPRSVEADLFKTLRTNILFPEQGEPRRTILVTSALPGDGKSFVSSNLAISIASGIEENVVLMDCDIRKPSIHKYFGITGHRHGLSEYLSGKGAVTDIVVKSVVNKLTIIPAGKPPVNPTDLLTSMRMRNLLNDIKTSYNDRYVIIDSPPPAMASETNAIAKFVDGVIVVVKSGKTPRKAVSEVIEGLGKEKILGIILNQAEQKVKKYYGHTKSYYAVSQA